MASFSTSQDPKANWMTTFPSSFLHPIPYPYILPSPKVLCKLRAVCSLQLEHILFWLQGSCVWLGSLQGTALFNTSSLPRIQSLPQHEILLNANIKQMRDEPCVQQYQQCTNHSQLTTTCKLPVPGVGVKPLCHQLTLFLSLSLSDEPQSPWQS